jgi:hypothetical protein|tara:strand:- start:105 stop:608 length:504 start_codon:yes stop_codon:yes gene_type:complete
MRKILLILIFIPFIGKGQIKMIENTSSTQEIVGKLENALGVMKIFKYNKLSSIFYNVSFKNMKYMELNDYTEFTFEETSNDFESLYSMIIDGFNFENKGVLYEHALNYKIYNEIILDIGKGRRVYLMYGKKGLAPIAFKFLYKDENGIEGWSQWLRLKQINKLFGKK